MIGTTRSRVSFFMNKFRELGLIDYNGHIEVHTSLLNVVLHDQPQIKRTEDSSTPSLARGPDLSHCLRLGGRWSASWAIFSHDSVIRSQTASSLGLTALSDCRRHSSAFFAKLVCGTQSQYLRLLLGRLSSRSRAMR
jgi:hypothetical protein